jgi:hypothetical protein
LKTKEVLSRKGAKTQSAAALLEAFFACLRLRENISQSLTHKSS